MSVAEYRPIPQHIIDAAEKLADQWRTKIRVGWMHGIPYYISPIVDNPPAGMNIVGYVYPVDKNGERKPPPPPPEWTPLSVEEVLAIGRKAQAENG